MPNGKADAVQDAQTDELATSTDEPVNTDEITDVTGDTDKLEFDELLGRKDPNNKRGGLSRKEARELKDDEEEPTPSEIEELRQEINKLKTQTASKQVESQFETALASAGVDVSTFNLTYKSDYLAKFEELQASGVQMDKAVDFALKMVLPKFAADEAENRSNARVRTALPPTGKTQSKTVYKQSEIDAMATSDRTRFKDLMTKHTKGEITIV